MPGPPVKPRAPPLECITTALIEETTGVGVEEHNCLDELEIIFSSLKCVALDDGASGGTYRSGLGRCARLRRLSLIDCGLERRAQPNSIADRTREFGDCYTVEHELRLPCLRALWYSALPTYLPV